MAHRTARAKLSSPNKVSSVTGGATAEEASESIPYKGAPFCQPEPIKVTEVEDAVLFTSFNGTVREVGELPPNLGRATALASEKAMSKIWGTSEEEAACQDMQREI